MALVSSKQSLTRTTLIKMGIRIALIVIAVTLLSYWHLFSILESQTLEQLEKYIVERGQRETQLFMLAEDNHAVFKKEFLWQLEQQDDQDPKAEFDRLFMRWEDGTVRNRPKNFDGTRQAGVFIGKIDGKIPSLNADIRRRVLTAYHLLNDYGAAWHNRFQNTYVTTPENIASLYWPEGPTWAIDAAVDLYMPDEEYVWVADQQHNPARKSVWTGVFVDDVTKTWMVSGETPIYIADQHIATVGHDIILNELFDRTINDHLEGAYNLIFREDGRLIAHPDYMDKIIAADGNFNILTSNDQHLFNIFQTVKNRQPGTIALENTKDNEYLAVTKIAGPDWHFVIVYPKSLLTSLAIQTARFILILGLISLLIEIILLFLVLRRQIAKPLHTLIVASKQVAAGNFKIQLDTTRQDEIGHLAQSFNTMSVEVQAREDSLREANQLKDDFLANTSHELRTPLNGIIGIAESLIDGATGKLPEKTKTNLAMIVGSGKRLATLVNDILDFSKLKHQSIDLQLKPIGLREIVDIVLTLSQPLIHNKPIQLVNAIPAELPSAHADENRLQQILYNLIGNAIKFTESGMIEVSAKKVYQQLELIISDTGIGISEDKLDRIFESFEQAEGSTAREYGGTGLGLAVTKQLIQLHQGDIWVKSILGQGSQFFLTLPIAEGATSQLSTETLSLSTVQTISEISTLTETTSNKIHLASKEQLNILIVDDEPVNLQVLHNYLSLQNYHIIQATSGFEALTLIKEGLKPDAILLDVMMPKMTGYEVTQTIREQWTADEVPILLLTAKNRVADLVVGLESGANDYLTKPFSKDELLARLNTHLQIKKLKDQALLLALENERMKTELEITRRIQTMILPQTEELERITGLAIAGFMEPAEEVGGDYYDVLQHDKSGRILISIGDVTGHGLESGMLMLMTQAAVRTLLENDEQDTVKFFNSLNGMIYKNGLFGNLRCQQCTDYKANIFLSDVSKNILWNRCPTLIIP